MGLGTPGKGRQSGPGNVNETEFGVMGAPQTATVTATLTAAQVLGGVLVGTAGTSAAAYTLPTVAVLEAALAETKVDAAFDLVIINLGTSSGVITLTAGTGWTLVGLATVAVSGVAAQWRCRKTGDGAYTAYRIA